MTTLARSVLIAFLTASSVAVAQPADKGHAHGASTGSKEMHDSMMRGAKEMQAMRMSGDVDKDFAMMMKKHHEDGVKMAQVQLSKGKDAKMQEMARKIVDAQKKEIAEFDEWLKARK